MRQMKLSSVRISCKGFIFNFPSKLKIKAKEQSGHLPFLSKWKTVGVTGLQENAWDGEYQPGHRTWLTYNFPTPFLLNLPRTKGRQIQLKFILSVFGKKVFEKE